MMRTHVRYMSLSTEHPVVSLSPRERELGGQRVWVYVVRVCCRQSGRWSDGAAEWSVYV